MYSVADVGVHMCRPVGDVGVHVCHCYGLVALCLVVAYLSVYDYLGVCSYILVFVGC